MYETNDWFGDMSPMEKKIGVLTHKKLVDVASDNVTCMQEVIKSHSISVDLAMWHRMSRRDFRFQVEDSKLRCLNELNWLRNTFNKYIRATSWHIYSTFFDGLKCYKPYNIPVCFKCGKVVPFHQKNGKR